MSVTAKWCGGCQRERPRSAFNRSRRTSDGLQTQCRDCVAARRDAWAAAHPERVAAHQSAYRKRNRPKENAKQRRYMERLRGAVFAAYGDACSCCGEDRREFLTVDHVGGRDAAHRGKRTLQVYILIRRDGFPQFGYCPHRLEEEADVRRRA